jgi:hypothetical protein
MRKPRRDGGNAFAEWGYRTGGFSKPQGSSLLRRLQETTRPTAQYLVGRDPDVVATLYAQGMQTRTQ